MENQISQEHTSRLDVEMVKRGISRSRSAALDQIKRGKVSVNGKKISKPSQTILKQDTISLDNEVRFVSRAGEKLSFALSEFSISPTGLMAMDIGSSTGGFTDCLLKSGAKKVIAVDVGTDQLIDELRYDRRVELHEGTNVRSFNLPYLVDLVVIDVSFISLTYVLPKAYEFLKIEGAVIALIKPQFEVGMEIAKKFEGVIKDPALQRNVVYKIINESKKIGFEVIACSPSPIEGEKGNKEFLIHLKKLF